MPCRSIRCSASRLAGTLAGTAVIAGCGPAAASVRIPPAPVLLNWPDPAFAAERQCQGKYRPDDLARYIPRARLAMSLPGTQSVSLDAASRCITVNVRTVGSGRLAELVLRGVAVPRRAVLLRLVDEPTHRVWQ